MFILHFISWTSSSLLLKPAGKIQIKRGALFAHYQTRDLQDKSCSSADKIRGFLNPKFTFDGLV